MLTHVETMALLARVRAGDKAAEDTLLSENLALVRSIVRR